MEQAKDVGLEHDNSSEVEAGGAKRKNAVSESEPGLIRVKLSVQLSLQVRNTIADLKARGVTLSPEELLEKYLDAVPKQYFARQVLMRTPEEFYIREAIQVPELREKLAKQAMKALLHKKGGSKAGVASKKGRTEAVTREEIPGDRQVGIAEVTNDGAH
jgi:hypothetical protein